MSNTKLPVNDEITAQEIRLIYEDGTNVVTSLSTARIEATRFGLDLVQMGQQETPVVKMLDYAQYQYEIKQAEKIQKKKQRASIITTKEIQLKIGIQDHDAQIKQKQIIKFLDKGDQVRISLRLTGRSRSNRSMQIAATDKVEIFIQNIGKFSIVSPVTFAGDTVSVIVKPKAL